MTELVMAGGIFVLAVLSGMLGFGVALAAIPFLSLFLPDLVRQVQPLGLALGGVTALFAALGFHRSGLVDGRTAAWLSVLAGLASPLGVLLAQRVDPRLIWLAYFGTATYMLWRLLRARPLHSALPRRLVWLAILAIPIAVFSTFVGAGVGFLLVPTLIAFGFEPKRAAGTNAVVVVAQSASALAFHLPHAQLNLMLTATLLTVGALGAYLGARLTSLRLTNQQFKYVFVAMMATLLCCIGCIDCSARDRSSSCPNTNRRAKVYKSVGFESPLTLTLSPLDKGGEGREWEDSACAATCELCPRDWYKCLPQLTPYID
jgi:uncharacterized membrane protein YfcA